MGHFSYMSCNLFLSMTPLFTYASKCLSLTWHKSLVSLCNLVLVPVLAKSIQAESCENVDSLPSHFFGVMCRAADEPRLPRFSWIRGSTGIVAIIIFSKTQQYTFLRRYSSMKRVLRNTNIPHEQFIYIRTPLVNLGFQIACMFSDLYKDRTDKEIILLTIFCGCKFLK